MRLNCLDAFKMTQIRAGLALATMCVDLVGGHYIAKFHNIGRKIQSRMKTFGDLIAYQKFLRNKYGQQLGLRQQPIVLF